MSEWRNCTGQDHGHGGPGGLRQTAADRVQRRGRAPHRLLGRQQEQLRERDAHLAQGPPEAHGRHPGTEHNRLK